MSILPSLSALGLVALGGGLGAAARLVVSQLAGRLLGAGFPWGTFSVNVLGGLIMGLVVGWFVLHHPTQSSPLRLFLTTGVMGGFTTFSAFSLELVDLVDGGKIGLAASYALLSVILSAGAVFAGLHFAKQLS